MGGDNFPFCSSSTEESVVEDNFNKQPLGLSSFLENSVVFQTKQRQKHRIYDEVLRRYDDVDNRIEHLQEAKRKILSYTPGSLMGKTNEELLRHYDVPKTTALLLIGPKGSGKSSIVNKLSRIFEDNVFTPERAQVSYKSSAGDGTYFIQEYTIPRGSNSLCVYDTRSLSDNTSENLEELHHWMTKGIRQRQPILRNSDDIKLMASIRCKAHQYGHYSSKARMVNFVIFVVNGVSVLEDMANSNEENKSYTKMITSEFNNPLLSFTDDRPAVVVTHGDLLSITDRAHVRIYLGELFGVPPHTQVFDIPESSDPVTNLSIVDMILYCLERADRNLPYKGWSLDKVSSMFEIFYPLYYLFVFSLYISLEIEILVVHQAFLRNFVF
ncbi:hypothetical protein Leryth_003318 [Lithospermum erythrorhizon]|nr:hypothetical protein Leryth_003318 [Lithospermum erythrorhizon]